jgi:hypothetical protein
MSNGNVELTFDGFDLDYDGELEIYLNGRLVDKYPHGDMIENEEVWVSLVYDASSFIKQGANELVFTLGQPRRGNSIKNVKLTANGIILIQDFKTYTIADESPSLAYKVTVGAQAISTPTLQIAAVVVSAIIAGYILYKIF